MLLSDPRRVERLRLLLDFDFTRDLRDPTLRLWVPVQSEYRSTLLRPSSVQTLAEIAEAIEPNQMIAQRLLLERTSLAPDDLTSSLSYLKKIGILRLTMEREEPWFPLERWVGYGPFYGIARVEMDLRAKPEPITHYARRNRSRSP